MHREELMKLLAKTLGDFDSKANYRVVSSPERIQFSFKVPLSIYNFTWEFNL